ACACVRAAAAKTCGGVLTKSDGSRATDCTPIFTRGDVECTGDKPCTFVHGPGNASSGIVGCNGLSNTNLSFTQDSGGVAHPPPPTPMIGGGPAIITLGDSCACASNGDCPGGQTCNVGNGRCSCLADADCADLDVVGAGVCIRQCVGGPTPN